MVDNHNTNSLYEEITENKARQLLDENISDEFLKKVIMDKFAIPGLHTAHKNFFDGLYVFSIKLSEEMNLIISVDRKRFWVSNLDIAEITKDQNLKSDAWAVGEFVGLVTS